MNSTVYLKTIDAEIKTWEELAAKGLQWCCYLNQAVTCFEVKCLAFKAKKRVWREKKF